MASGAAFMSVATTSACQDGQIDRLPDAPADDGLLGRVIAMLPWVASVTLHTGVLVVAAWVVFLSLTPQRPPRVLKPPPAWAMVDYDSVPDARDLSSAQDAF